MSLRLGIAFTRLETNVSENIDFCEIQILNKKGENMCVNVSGLICFFGSILLWVVENA